MGKGRCRMSATPWASLLLSDRFDAPGSELDPQLLRFVFPKSLGLADLAAAGGVLDLGEAHLLQRGRDVGRVPLRIGALRDGLHQGVRRTAGDVRSTSAGLSDASGSQFDPEVHGVAFPSGQGIADLAAAAGIPDIGKARLLQGGRDVCRVLRRVGALPDILSQGVWRISGHCRCASADDQGNAKSGEASHENPLFVVKW